MNKIKVGVIGVGYLGNFHAQKYAQDPQCELIGVCDTDLNRAEEIALKYHTQAFADYRDILTRVDAVSIVTPTVTHHRITLDCLDNNIHVLVEKPISTNLSQATEMIDHAKTHGLILQVGHLERFNCLIQAAMPLIENPRFIESVRLSPFKPRGTDVNVVLDLMIHDIDLIQFIVGSKITEIRANGALVLSNFIDIGNVRIEFANGCIANITASRASTKVTRKLRVFQPDVYMSLDLHNKNLSIHRKGKKEMSPGIPEIISEDQAFDQGDALRDEIKAFLTAIRTQTPPVVSGEDGKHALATALEITHIMRAQLPPETQAQLTPLDA